MLKERCIDWMVNWQNNILTENYIEGMLYWLNCVLRECCIDGMFYWNNVLLTDYVLIACLDDYCIDWMIKGCNE